MTQRKHELTTLKTEVVSSISRYRQSFPWLIVNVSYLIHALSLLLCLQLIMPVS
jgi:hypothetical protein